jgi:hypothetical protein
VGVAISITTAPKDIKMTIGECYEQLYAHRFENLNEIDLPCPSKTQSAKTNMRRNG